MGKWSCLSIVTSGFAVALGCSRGANTGEEAAAPSPPEPTTASEVEPIEPASTPFRLVIDATYGSVSEHDGHKIYSGEAGVFDLSAQKSLGSCQFTRGYLMSGTSLYFAARMSPYSACPDAPLLLEYADGAWQVRHSIDAHDISIDEWTEGTTIATVVPYRSGPPWGYEILRLSGSAKPPRPLRPARNQPDENSPDCYSELQRPLTLDAFPNGAILVTGESRCDAGYGEEELSDLYRPVVESFPPGGGKSTVRTLPFDRIDWVLSQSDGTLWILGAVLKEPDDPETATKHLVFVDHERIIPIEARLGAARALITGPGAPGDDRAEAKSAAPLPRSVWLLDDKSLRPALEGPKSIALPEGCAPVDAWFEGKYAWLECEEGVFTNDPDQAPFDIPKNDDQCDALQPRPETDVAGLFDPTRSSSSCGRREVEHQAPGDPDSFGY